MITEADARYAVGWLENHFENPPTVIELLASSEEGLKQVGIVEACLKRLSTEVANLDIEVAQLKFALNQTQSADQKAKENEDWKRLVRLDIDENGHAFVYVNVDDGEDFVAGEAFRNSALQVEFEPQPNIALTIQYIDAISTLLKKKAHELPVRNV